MICPGCGFDNPEESKMCTKCGYKFEFLHAYNDPNHMRFFNLSGFKTRKQKTIRIFLIGFLIIIFILVIVSWIRSF